MKELRRFMTFDSEKFFEGVKLEAASEPTIWRDKDGTRVLGTNLKLEIEKDNPDKYVGDATNEGEQFSVKSSKPITEYGWVRRHTQVELKDVQVATVWGDYNNQLSVRGDVVRAKVEK